MENWFWFMLGFIFGLPLIIFGVHYVIIGNELNNKKLTRKTNGYLSSYNRQKNVYTGGKRGRIAPYGTSYNYTYTVDGKKYELHFHIYSNSVCCLQRTVKVVYLKRAPKYAYCDATQYNHLALGCVLLFLGLIYYAMLLLCLIIS